MYVYLVMANGGDEFESYTPLLEVCKTEKEANVAVMDAKKVWPKDCLFIRRKRVNAKDKFYVVLSEFDDAGFILQDFVHITTSEKRAKGFVENLVGRKMYDRSSVKIQVLNK